MSNIIAIDTGKRGCGVVLYRNNLLTYAAYADSKRGSAFAPSRAAPTEPYSRTQHHQFTAHRVLDIVERWLVGDNRSYTVLLEFPRIYRNSQQEKDQNDLLDLAAVAGSLASQFRGFDVQYVHVSDWKGQLDKVAAWHHIWKRLSADEKAVYEAGVKDLPKALHHNVQDAVGIGLWASGRF